MNILFSPAHRLLLMMLRLTMTLTEAALNLKSTAAVIWERAPRCTLQLALQTLMEVPKIQVGDGDPKEIADEESKDLLLLLLMMMMMIELPT